MKNGICYIVGAGEDCRIDFIPTTDDFVIAADAGLRYLEQAEINTDLVIGDFDTLNAIPQHPNVISLSTEKNDTDMLGKFFVCNQKKTAQKEISFARKYKEYQAFMNAVNK